MSKRLLVAAMMLLTLTAPLPAAESPAKSARKASTQAKADPAAPKWKLLPGDAPAGVTEKRGIVCAVYDRREVTLDLWMPDAPGRYPGVLLIHGGGWSQGQVHTDKALAGRIAQAGYVVAQVSYRLSGEAMYPAALHDCKAAVRWMRANAKAIKLDPTQVGCMGGSAGGHLSGLLAMTSGMSEFEGDGGHANASSEIQACIVMAATMDLHLAYAEKSHEAIRQFLGSDPAAYKLASPITHVRAGSPPAIFIEGEKDTYKIGRPEMQEKLRGLGIHTELHTLKHAPHPFWMSDPWCRETADIAIRFFDATLKKQ